MAADANASQSHAGHAGHAGEQQMPRPRWLGLIAILLVSGAVIGGVRVPPNLDGGTRNLVTVAATGATILAVAVWLLFFAALRRGGKLLVMAAVLVPLATIKLEAYWGDLQPVFRWRWSKPSDHYLDKAISSDSAAQLERTAHDFPQFLGPTRTAQTDSVQLSTDWSKPPKQLWRQPIGAGWSSFAVVGNYAFTQEQRGDDELVTCYQRDTGRPVWSHSDHGRFKSMMGGDGPRATPTIVAGRVYAMAAKGMLLCLDAASGRLIWSRDVIAENHASLPTWGMSGSPLVESGRVVVSAGGPDGHSLVAYDADNGKPLWQGGSSPASYASPVLATIAGRREVIMLNAEDVTGHDFDSGAVLWHYDWPGGQPKVPQPVAVGDDRVLITAGYGLGAKLLAVDLSKPPEAAARALWSSRSLRPKFTNVVVHAGYIYGIDDGRALNCLSLADGKLTWRSSRSAEYGHGQILRAGDVLLVQCESGDVALVSTSPERFEELARFHAIDGKTWNNPALSGKYLLVRNAEEAACYELPQEKNSGR